MIRVRQRRHPVEAVVTTLPFMMLLIGVVLFYRGEMAESAGAPVLAESVRVEGRFRSVSQVASGGEGRHYLWFDTERRLRGPRITADQAVRLEAAELADGAPIVVDMAPHVAGSTTLWAWRVRRDGRVIYGQDVGIRPPSDAASSDDPA